jgi:hypothetical protein
MAARPHPFKTIQARPAIRANTQAVDANRKSAPTAIASLNGQRTVAIARCAAQVHVDVLLLK